MDYTLAPVTIQQILVFLQVVESQGFAKAGAALHMTQSAVSKSIQKLEQILGITLFTRTTRELNLTPAGDLLYREWTLHMQEIHKSYYRALELQNHKNDTLHIGLLNTAHPKRYFREIEIRFRKSYPEISIQLESEYMTDLVDKLAANLYDLIMVPDFHRFSLEEHSLAWKWAARSRAYLIVSSGHPLAEKTEVSLRDTISYDFISLHGAQTSEYARDLTERFQKYGAVPKLSFYYNNAYDIQYLYRPGNSILFTDAYFDRLEDSDSVKIPVTDQYNGIICGYQPGTKNHCVKKFLELLPQPEDL